jgi:hypothetical protein
MFNGRRLDNLSLSGQKYLTPSDIRISIFCNINFLQVRVTRVIVFSVTKSVGIPLYMKSSASIPKRHARLFYEEVRCFIFEWAQ